MKNQVLAATVACSLALAGYAADAKTNWNEQCLKQRLHERIALQLALATNAAGGDRP